MANVIKLNFKGVEPAQGRRTDYVTPGTYRLEIAEVSKANNKSSTGKIMPVVSFTVASRGSEQGKRLRDQFVLEGDGDKVPFGLQRFLALLESCKIKPPRKDGVSLDLDKLVGKQCVAEVYDEEYNNKMVSRIGSFLMEDADDDSDDDEGEEDSDEEEDDEDSEDEEDDEEEEAPPPARKAAAKPAAKAASKPAAKKPAKKAAADDDDEDDEDELPW